MTIMAGGMAGGMVAVRQWSHGTGAVTESSHLVCKMEAERKIGPGKGFWNLQASPQ